MKILSVTLLAAMLVAAATAQAQVYYDDGYGYYGYYGYYYGADRTSRDSLDRCSPCF